MSAGSCCIYVVSIECFEKRLNGLFLQVVLQEIQVNRKLLAIVDRRHLL